MSRSSQFLPFGLTMAVAALGGALATLVGIPVGWLIGSAVAVAVASLSGMPIHLPQWLRDIAFFVLGVQAGSGVTPEVVEQMLLWPLSFAIQMAGVVAVVVATAVFLQRVFGWDRETAFFASLPGALSFVLAAASETRADMTRIVTVQSLRLLLLIGALIPALALLEGGSAAGAGTRLGGDATLFDYVFFLVACLAGAWAGVKSRVPGGLILGALFASAVLHGSAISSITIPQAVAVPGLVTLGAFIGARLKYEDRARMPALIPASLGAFAIGIALSGAAGLLAFWTLGIDGSRLALAYAPGALESLTVIAYQFNIDPAYVAAHHVVRFVAIALAVPVLARRFPRRPATPEAIARSEAAPDVAAHDTSASGQEPDGR